MTEEQSSHGIERPVTTISRVRVKLAYLVGSSLLLVTLTFWHYLRFDLFGSGLMLGWDTPSYVRLAEEIQRQGALQSMAGWGFPHLYPQLLAVLGFLSGNVTLAEKILPVVFALLSIFLVFLVTLSISGNVHAAGVSALLQSSSIAFLRLFSDLHRNLMAFSLSLAAMVVAQRMWYNEQRLRDYVFLSVSVGVVAFTQLETFVILSLTLLISSIVTRRIQNIVASVLAVAAPSTLLVLAFPQFVSTYLQTPIIRPTDSLSLADVAYYMGGFALALPLSLAGGTYAFLKWRKSRNVMGLLIGLWTTALLGIVLVIAAKAVSLPSELGVRALIIVPSYVLAPLGVLLLWDALSAIRTHSVFTSMHVKAVRMARILLVVLVLGILIANSAFAVSQSQTYFTPYISSTAYNKVVQTASYFGQESFGVPIVVFKGQSVWLADLYRSYVGALLGEHFAYYGDLDSLLQLRPSSLRSLDPFVSRLEADMSQRYLEELTGTFPGPLWFSHSSYVRDRATLLSHPILLISPEFYDPPLSYRMAEFHLGHGIYVVPPQGLASYPQSYTAGSVTVLRDGVSARLLGEYAELDPYDPYLAYVLVNASYGHSEYNITSFPPDWKLVGIRQGGDSSIPESHPRRPDGAVAVLGNDYADSSSNWSQVPADATIGVDQFSRKEGSASIQVSGKVDPDGNLWLVLRLPAPVDFAPYALISFWAECAACSGLAVYLMDEPGNFALFYDIRLSGEFARFAIAVDRPTTTSTGFNVHAVTAMSFVAYSFTSTSLTLRIDDIVVEDESVNPTYVYKGRVLPSDLVEFQFSQRLAGPGLGLGKSPALAYEPGTDVVFLVATIFLLPAVVGLPMLVASGPFRKIRERFHRIFLP